MGTFRFDGQRLVGTDGQLRIEIDAETGAVVHVENLVTGHELVADGVRSPWRLAAQGGSFDRWDDLLPSTYESTAPEPAGADIELYDDGQRAVIKWETTAAGTTVTAELQFGIEGTLECHPRVTVAADERPPESLTYPVLSDLQPLSSDGRADELIFPYHSGWLVRNPLDQPPMAGPYPEGYSGCPMQFMAYLEADVGGFYLAAHDPHSTAKYLTFGAEEWSIRHETWDLREGRSIEYGYPIVIAAMTVGDWYEAADRYREWALTEAPWIGTRDAPGDSDRDERRWLHEGVGLAVWGTPSSLDWSPFYEFYADVAGTPLHICAGWDWPGQRPHTVGKEGWFPADFHPSNVEAWESHYVTPYMNDLFISNRADDFLEQWEPSLLLPYAQFSFDHFSKPQPDWIQGNAPDADPTIISDVNYFLCPETDAFRELHSWRDATLVEDYPVDGVCYDISSGNPWQWSRCWRAEHGHPPGRGRDIIQSYDELNRHSKAETRARTDEYLVQGVETIIENVIGSVDFYVMRAGAGPVGALETWLPVPEDPPGGDRELIPLFEAVYHDVGPVRHDGWLTLAADRGDLFFWLAARIVLRWGGLLSLHYANNPPERPPGYDGPAEVIDWSGARQQWDELPEASFDKIAFVRELARARTEFASPYLGHGRLLRPVPCDVPVVELEFNQQISQLPGLVNTGSWLVPSVVQGAWEAPDGRVGVMFAVVGEEALSLSIDVDCWSLWELDLAGRRVTVETVDGSVDGGSVSPTNELQVELDLEPRTVTLLEIRP